MYVCVCGRGKGSRGSERGGAKNKRGRYNAGTRMLFLTEHQAYAVVGTLVDLSKHDVQLEVAAEVDEERAELALLHEVFPQLRLGVDCVLRRLGEKKSWGWGRGKGDG